jgi:hypothetical protein
MPLVVSPTSRKPIHALGCCLLSGKHSNASPLQRSSASPPNSSLVLASIASRGPKQCSASFNVPLRCAVLSWALRAKNLPPSSHSSASDTKELSPCSARRSLEGSLAALHQTGSQQRGRVSIVGRCGTAGPNTSLNLRANGMAQSPRHSTGVHYLCRGLCATPLSPG